MNSSLLTLLNRFSFKPLSLTFLAPRFHRYHIPVVTPLSTMSLSPRSTWATSLLCKTMTQPIWILWPTIYTYKCAQRDQRVPRTSYTTVKPCHSPSGTVVLPAVKIMNVLLHLTVIETEILFVMPTANTPHFLQYPDQIGPRVLPVPILRHSWRQHPVRGVVLKQPCRALDHGPNPVRGHTTPYRVRVVLAPRVGCLFNPSLIHSVAVKARAAQTLRHGACWLMPVGLTKTSLGTIILSWRSTVTLSAVAAVVFRVYLTKMMPLPNLIQVLIYIRPCRASHFVPGAFRPALTLYRNLMLRDGMLSPHSKLLPQNVRPDSLMVAIDSNRPGSTVSVGKR